jgi:hypothetical protein
LKAGDIRLFQKDAEMYWQLTVPVGVMVSCSPAWYSPSYGIRIPCLALELEAEVVLPRDASWNFTFTKIGYIK